MTTKVSIRDCARFLGIEQKQVWDAIEQGVVRHGTGTGQVIPSEVYDKLVEMGEITECPCCGIPCGVRADDHDEGET